MNKFDYVRACADNDNLKNWIRIPLNRRLKMLATYSCMRANVRRVFEIKGAM